MDHRFSWIALRSSLIRSSNSSRPWAQSWWGRQTCQSLVPDLTVLTLSSKQQCLHTILARRQGVLPGVLLLLLVAANVGWRRATISVGPCESQPPFVALSGFEFRPGARLGSGRRTVATILSRCTSCTLSKDQWREQLATSLCSSMQCKHFTLAQPSGEWRASLDCLFLPGEGEEGEEMRKERRG